MQLCVTQVPLRDPACPGVAPQEMLADVKVRGKKQVYILKPDAGCQGRGIRLVQGGKEDVVLRVLSEMATPNVVAQHYMPSPFLIHGYKFDLRIYCLVLSCDPLRVFIYREGLARWGPPGAGGCCSSSSMDA